MSADKRGEIHDALVAALAPVVLEVVDESHRHAGGPAAQSHYKVTVVSEAFAGQSLVARHRSVQAATGDMLAHGRIHALAIHVYTPAEWAARGGEVPASPPCLGGSKG